MDIDYKINGKKLDVFLDNKIYPLISVKKAMITFMEYAYVSAKNVNNRIKIHFEFKENNVNLDEIAKEFINECLKESLRYDISKETQNIRELILGRALYSSCIRFDDGEPNDINIKYNEIEDVDFNIDEIAVNWFDINRKEE